MDKMEVKTIPLPGDSNQVFLNLCNAADAVKVERLKYGGSKDNLVEMAFKSQKHYWLLVELEPHEFDKWREDHGMNLGDA